MDKRLLFVLPLSWILAGCPGMDPLVCDPYAGPTPPCSGDPNAPHATINTASANLNADPYCLSAKQGTFMVFSLVPHDKNDLGTVEIFPKDEADTWLAGENRPHKDLIIIPVPDDIPIGEYDYGISTSTKCVDPRVSVE